MLDIIYNLCKMGINVYIRKITNMDAEQKKITIVMVFFWKFLIIQILLEKAPELFIMYLLRTYFSFFFLEKPNIYN